MPNEEEKVAVLAKQLREKLNIEHQDLTRKIRALKSLHLKDLIDQIPDLETKYQKLLNDDNSYRHLQQGFISSTGDCPEAKKRIAILTNQAVGKNAAEREAWLTLQRTEDPDLANILETQSSTMFQIENNRIALEMAKKRLDSILKILALRTAQIQFLTSTYDIIIVNK
jgi:hypothetical protein